MSKTPKGMQSALWGIRRVAIAKLRQLNYPPIAGAGFGSSVETWIFPNVGFV